MDPPIVHVPESPKEPTDTPEYEDDLPDYGHAKDDSPEHESPQPQYWPESGAPDGAATDLFAGVQYPFNNIPAIQLINTQRPKIYPFLMSRYSHLDIKGPENWPEDTPIDEMTPTYVPIEMDIRYCNANLIGVDEDPEAPSRLGFFHFCSDLFRRLLCDHWELTGDDQLLVEAKQQTFGHHTDLTFLTALGDAFKGLMDACDPDGSAKLPGQGPVRLCKYWPAVKEYMIKSLPRPRSGFETRFYVIAGDIACFGATRTPIMNLAKLLKSTHTVIPDNFIAIRYATFEDLANVLEAIVGPYKRTSQADVDPTVRLPILESILLCHNLVRFLELWS